MTLELTHFTEQCTSNEQKHCAAILRAVPAVSRARVMNVFAWLWQKYSIIIAGVK